MLLSKASSSADWLILASALFISRLTLLFTCHIYTHLPSMSLKLLPILGVPSDPSLLVPCLLGLSLANSALCLGLSGPGLTPEGFGASLAELAKDELASNTSDFVTRSRLLLASLVRCTVEGVNWRFLSIEERFASRPYASVVSCVWAKGSDTLLLRSVPSPSSTSSS
jgi:hypothetical protein